MYNNDEKRWRKKQHVPLYTYTMGNGTLYEVMKKKIENVCHGIKAHVRPYDVTATPKRNPGRLKTILSIPDRLLYFRTYV